MELFLQILWWACGVGFFAGMVGIGIAETKYGKKDGRFKTGYKNNDVPDLPAARRAMLIAIAITLLSLSGCFLL
ncbi:MAG: hypothetical protein MK089_05610 [Phycisphaerales bacterium]|nr:hypothetical protein [Phycisphaerales bacterium]